MSTAITDRAIDRAIPASSRPPARSQSLRDQDTSTVQHTHRATDPLLAPDLDFYDRAPCTYYVGTPTLHGRVPTNRKPTPNHTHQHQDKTPHTHQERLAEQAGKCFRRVRNDAPATCSGAFSVCAGCIGDPTRSGHTR